MHKEKRDVLEEEVREIDERDMEEFGTLDSGEKTVAILGDKWWPQAAKQEEGVKTSKTFLCNIWKQRNERPTVGSVRSIGTVLHLETDAWSMVKRLKQATNEYDPLSPRSVQGKAPKRQLHSTPITVSGIAYTGN